MELEGLLLLTCKCCKGENTELAAISLRTPMTDCHEKMLDDLRRQAPESLRCHGLIASRVVAKGGDGGEMYFISPVRSSDGKRILMQRHISATQKLRRCEQKNGEKTRD